MKVGFTIAVQEPPEAALAADMTSVVSAQKTSVETNQDICCSSRKGTARPPLGVFDFIEMSGVFSAAATDVLALDATDVFSADTTDVFSAAKAACGGSCPAIRPPFNSKANVALNSKANVALNSKANVE